MKRLNECISEKFLGGSYEKYKNKVIDVLTSLGIIVPPSLVKTAEDWIRDFFVDGSDAFDCAKSLISELARKNVVPRRPETVHESVAQYTKEIIGSAPQHRRSYAVKMVAKLNEYQQNRFNKLVRDIADVLKVDQETIISTYGFELLELIYGNMLTDEEIVEKYAAYGYLLAKRDINKDMDLGEAMKILEAAGEFVSSGSFMKDLYAALEKEFRNAEVENTVSFDEGSKKIYITDDDDPWLEISYIPSAEKVCLENHQNSNEYVEYYPKLQGGAEGIANRIRNKYGNP